LHLKKDFTYFISCNVKILKHAISFEVGEPLEIFVRNMHQNGLSAEEISQKSGIPYETVSGILNG